MKTKNVLLAILFFASINLYAKVSGTVYLKKDFPAIGAFISVKGTTTGTITDFDGNFELDVPEGTLLEFSYLRYKDKTIPATNGMVVYMNRKYKERPASSPTTTATSASASTPAKSPAILTYVANSLKFTESVPNNTIEANEKCTIQLQVTNTGKGAGTGCMAKISASGSTAGLGYKNVTLPTIAVGQTQTVEIPVTANADTKDGQVTFTIEVTEPDGFGLQPVRLTVNTHALEKPLVKVVDYTIDGRNMSVIHKKIPFELHVLLQNVESGTATHVTAQITLPAGVMVLDGKELNTYPTLKGGEQTAIVYQLTVSNNYSASTLPIQIILRESHGRYAENKTINLQVDQSAEAQIDVTLPSQMNNTTNKITEGSLQRDGATVYNMPAAVAAASATNALQSVTVTTPFDMVQMSSVLATYKNEFGEFEMPDRDNTFPYALVRVHLTGNSNAIRVGKQTLQLNMGQSFQVQKTVTSHENQILFLIPNSARTIYLTCGDGCLRQQIFSGRLMPNSIYEGTVEVK